MTKALVVLLLLLAVPAIASAEGVVVNKNTCLVTWPAPQANVDGTNLADLKEYGIYVSATPTPAATSTAIVAAPAPDPVAGATAAWACSGLAAGQWYVQVDAVDLAGQRSARSALVPFVSVLPDVVPSAPGAPVITGP